MIIGLGLSGNVTEAGKIKIGEKGEMITSKKGKEFRPPQKLDHFKIVTTERDKDGDFVLATRLVDFIKKNGGIANEKGNLIGIPIRLLFDDIEKNFPTSLVSYVNGKRNCHGNGKKAFKRVDEFTKEHPCPCDRVKSNYDGKDKCKPFGTLSCFIDGDTLFGQAYKFRTTSKGSVNGILGGLKLVSRMTAGKLAGIPLMLTLNSKTTNIPSGGSTTVYVVSICYHGTLQALRDDAVILHSSEQQYLLDTDTDFTDPTIETEVGEEFYPDAIDVEGVSVKKTESDVEKVNFGPEQDVDKITDVNVGGTSVEITEEEKEMIFSRDLPGADDLNQNSNPNSLMSVDELKKIEPAGSYRALYDRFIIEKDIDKAMKLANRIMRNHLVYWVITTYPDIEFDITKKKPDMLEIVENILKSTLLTKATGTKLEENDSGGIDDSGKDETEKSKSEELPSREWDNSEKISLDQLRKIVKLKTALVKFGKMKNDPEVWKKHVNYFLNTEGNPIDSAKALTTKQGAGFILMLEKYDDDIPF